LVARGIFTSNDVDARYDAFEVIQACDSRYCLPMLGNLVIAQLDVSANNRVCFPREREREREYVSMAILNILGGFVDHHPSRESLRGLSLSLILDDSDLKIDETRETRASESEIQR